jgi:regulator of PEP synthase PpsR (kinase-PPPase family)
MLTVFAVSDGTGATAERMVRSALAQFEEAAVSLVRRGQVRTPEQVRAVVREATGRDALVLHTLVSDDLRCLMLAEARVHGVDSMDLMGPMLDRLATHLKLTPQEKPGLFQQLAEAKSREIEAVNFAFRHDDGQNAEELGRAEVVLVGVSRTMKTPTTLYLAYRGWFAANVPIVPEIPLPPALLALPPRKVFCLMVSPSHLLEMRRVRAKQESIPAEPYTSLQCIEKELLYSQRVCREHRWRSVEITGKSVEEVSREIIATLASEAPQQKPPG